MSGWTARRFWTEARVEEVAGGFTVRLDARAVKTPAKAAFVVPTRALAEQIAAEWDAQGKTVDPATMPVTRAANSAIDKVAPQFDEVVAIVAEYGGSDLLCYRATGPLELVARQAEGWDPLLDWCAGALGAPLRVTQGVMHVDQPEASLAALHARVAALDPFRLTAFHDLVAISGSLVLAFAVTEERLPDAEAWRLSRIDEDWQAELWGADEEAERAAAARHAGFLEAGRFYRMCGDSPPAL
jgi:chaperone required for assembly of F1-ATPase